jgi:hypothetical protein
MEYLKLAKSSSNLNLHPLVKAMLISLDAARRGQADGEYLGMSGDADQTPEGKPSMVTAVSVSKKGEQLLLRISIYDRQGRGIANRVGRKDPEN